MRRVLSSWVRVGVVGTIRIASNSDSISGNTSVWARRDAHQTRIARHCEPRHVPLNPLPHPPSPSPTPLHPRHLPRDGAYASGGVRVHSRSRANDLNLNDGVRARFLAHFEDDGDVPYVHADAIRSQIQIYDAPSCSPHFQSSHAWYWYRQIQSGDAVMRNEVKAEHESLK